MEEKNRLYLGILIFLVVVVTGISWLYMIGRSIKEKEVARQQYEQIIPANQTFYEMREGSLYLVNGEGTATLLVDKDSLIDDRLRINRVIDYALSPDRTKLILFTEASIDDFLLFVVGTDGQNPEKFGIGREAKWSPDSARIAFTSPLAGADLFSIRIFNIISKKTFESPSQVDGCYPSYRQISWRNVDTLTGYSVCLDDMPFGNLVKEGQVEVAVRDFTEVE